MKEDLLFFVILFLTQGPRIQPADEPKKKKTMIMDNVYCDTKTPSIEIPALFSEMSVPGDSKKVIIGRPGVPWSSYHFLFGIPGDP